MPDWLITYSNRRQSETAATWFSFLIGLSKERPILGDHPKAHILDFGYRADFIKSGRFQVKSERFCADFMKSGRFQVKPGRFHADFM